MANKSMGEIISTLRREKGMTQKELADMLNITDKAVSKWERDIACPDTMTIPKLAEILGVSVEELMNAKSAPITGHKGAGFLINIILKAVPLAMGVAVIVTSLLIDFVFIVFVERIIFIRDSGAFRISSFHVIYSKP